MQKIKHTNQLIHETSPYLLQHAHNPVNWYPWSNEALETAKKENKPLLVSIGYSACHWCHVMEHESFEDDGIAQIMNDNFICIKVDREERPDVDNLYMEAVQMLTGQGGWPLNCFALPDGRPFYGGTYFPKIRWKEILLGIGRIFNEENEKALEQAELLTGEIISAQQLQVSPSDTEFPESVEVFDNLRRQFDEQNGGIGSAPKFPIPSIYEFLLTYYYYKGDSSALGHTLKTIDNITEGGIFDQIGGGFARYSTDDTWFAPHFEKMLYDNAQLLKLLSHAFQITKDKRYKDIIVKTVDFLETEMLSPEGGFYSALDADSEGREGKYYVWDYKDFSELLGDDSKLMCDYFGIRSAGNWEAGTNILSVVVKPEKLSAKYGLSEDRILNIIERSRLKLLNARSKRARPGLDSKIIASWNGLMISALVEVYKATQLEHALKMALNCAKFIERQMLEGDLLQRLFPNKRKIHGFLDDYAAVIAAFLSLFEQCADLNWLKRVENLVDYTLKYFFDPATGFFHYEPDGEKVLITRKIDTNDNVIPSGTCFTANFVL